MALFILILLYLLSTYFTFSKFKSVCSFHVSCMTLEFSFIAYFVRLLLLRAGDIETNPGPKKSIKFYHWNLNGLAAHGFVKIPLIEAFINTHNFDIICLSESFLDSTMPQNDENINIKGYSLLRAGHPGNGGVCSYYKEYLPLIARNDISCLQECLVTELSINKEKCFFTCLYRSPSQSHEELDTFCSNLDPLLSNINNNHPNCSILIGDFNAKSSKWCSSDKDNKAGCELDNITTSACYSQMIDKSTHFINESSSCIDLIFSSNPSLTKNCGIEHSIYNKCHHNIIYGTLNFKVPLPPPYHCGIWVYKKANIQNIQKAVSMFDWRSAFKGNTINKNYKILTDMLMNIFENFIPHKTKKICFHGYFFLKEKKKTCKNFL